MNIADVLRVVSFISGTWEIWLHNERRLDIFALFISNVLLI